MADSSAGSWRAQPRPPAASRRLDRNAMEVLSREESLDLIRFASIGRVGMVVGGVPVIVPVNFALLGDDVVFRTGTGSKLVAAVERRLLSVEVDSVDPVTRTGWSVLITGGSSELVRPDDIADADALGLDSWIAGRRRYIRVRSDSVSGRRLR